MFGTRTLTPAIMALTLITVACEDNALPDAQLSLGDLTEIVLDTDDILGTMLTEQGLTAPPAGDVPQPSMEVIVTDATFSRTRTCPAGGDVMWDGTAHRELDTDTGVRTGTFSGTRTKNDCAFTRGEFTITVNGSADWTHMRRRVDGAFDGLQTSTHVGSFTATRNDGAERSCSFDVVIVRDPVALTVSATGTICGEAIDRTRDWNPAS